MDLSIECLYFASTHYVDRDNLILVRGDSMRSIFYALPFFFGGGKYVTAGPMVIMQVKAGKFKLGSPHLLLLMEYR